MTASDSGLMPCARGCIRTPETEDQPALLMGARHGVLCDRCYFRLLHALKIAPDLIANMRWQITPSGQRSDEPGRSGKRFPPLPLRSGPLGDADTLYAKLVSWSEIIAGELGTRQPAASVWMNLTEAGGFRPVSPGRARELAGEITAWMERHLDAFTGSATVVAFHDDICWGWEDALGVFKLMGRYPLEPRPLRPADKRECPVCGQREVGVLWPDKLRADIEVSCDRCKWVAEPERYGFYARLFAS